MSWIALGASALSTGAGVYGAMQKKGNKASYNLNLPSYQASQYDAPSAAQLFSTLQNRVAGRDVGYSAEDLATMNDQAVDQSTKAANDMLNRSMAGRQQTGGITKGGTNVAREQAYMYGGGLKSNALRDVAINNAVQKRQEINAAIPEEQQFLGGERAQAETLYNNQMQQALLQKEEADKVQAYNTARNDSSAQDISGLIGGLGSGMSGNVNPAQYFGGGSSSGDSNNALLSLLSGGKTTGTGASTQALGQWIAKMFGKGGTASSGTEGVMG
jgi:hypothetical protein